MSNENNFLITKSNKLIEARYKNSLSVREQKIILYIVSKIQKDDDEFKTYNLSVKEFSELMGLEGSPKYTEFRKITESLLSKVIEIEEDGNFLQTHWLSSVKYNTGSGLIDFTFPQLMKPYLLQLKSEFTTYKIINILHLKSSYSIRMYELLKKNAFRKEFEMPVEELRLKLGTGKLYRDYNNFKTRVLTKAEQELEELTDIRFSYDEIKTGKKITRIKFKVFPNRKTNVIIDEKEPTDNESNNLHKLFKQNKIAIDEKTIERFIQMSMKIFGQDTYFEDLRKMCKDILKQDKDNHVGFITYILKNKLEAVELGLDHNEVPTGPNKKQGKDETVPEWFEHAKKVRKGEIVEEAEELSDEMKIMRDELLKSLGVKKEVAATNT